MRGKREKVCQTLIFEEEKHIALKIADPLEKGVYLLRSGKRVRKRDSSALFCFFCTYSPDEGKRRRKYFRQIFQFLQKNRVSISRRLWPAQSRCILRVPYCA
jgi:hypothetical protein